MDPDLLRRENENYKTACIKEYERKKREYEEQVEEKIEEIKQMVHDQLTNHPDELIREAKGGRTYLTLWKQNPFFCTTEKTNRCQIMNDAVKKISTYKGYKINLSGTGCQCELDMVWGVAPYDRQYWQVESLHNYTGRSI